MNTKNKLTHAAIDAIFHDAIDHGDPEALKMVRKLLEAVFVNAPPEMREYLDRVFENNDFERIKKAFTDKDSD